MSVTAAEVIALTGTKLPEPVVEAIIADAAVLAGPCIQALDAARRDAIIRWLSAHMVSTADGGGTSTLSSRSLGDASKSWARGTLGEGLKSSFFGQQALALDPSGCLARLGKPRATIQVV